MKIVYIGSSDFISKAIVDRLAQEGYDVYLISDKDVVKTSSIQHRFFRKPIKGDDYEKVLSSIRPDSVIFMGNNYLNYDQAGLHEDMALLSRSLKAVHTLCKTKFILLSSISVYRSAFGVVDESCSSLSAVDEASTRFLYLESIVKSHSFDDNIDVVILRGSDIYSDNPKEGDKDFLSMCFCMSHSNSGEWLGQYWPIHASDFADAITRAVQWDKRPIYNICGSSISAHSLYSLICEHEGIPKGEIRVQEQYRDIIINSSAITKDLCWSNNNDLKSKLQKSGVIKYTKMKVKPVHKSIISKHVRQLLENIALFCIFELLNAVCSSSSVFSHIDWGIIYIILISVAYNIYQGTIASLLTSFAYLLSSGLNVFELSTDPQYSIGLLNIMEYIFLGFIVSYTTNMLREDVNDVHTDIDMIKQEYNDMESINNENILIKNEYEDRLLKTDQGFSNLYNTVSRLMVQDEDRILMEIMYVLSEMLDTGTVSVYRGCSSSPWYRLVGALSEESVFTGSSINIDDYPHIREYIMSGDLYQGKVGSHDPAVVMPVMCDDYVKAVIVIMKLPYTSESLYHVNILKTMQLLLKDSISRAIEYADVSRRDHYIEGTDILKPEQFSKRVQLAKEKFNKMVAPYAVLKVNYTEGTLSSVSDYLSQRLRVSDDVGKDNEGNLLVLLNNTDESGAFCLCDRLSCDDIKVSLVGYVYVDY